MQKKKIDPPPPQAHARLLMLHAEIEGDEASVREAMTRVAESIPGAPIPYDDRRETAARVGTVISLFERCCEELARLEAIPTSDADDVNALSSARGFVSRARNILRGRFG